MMRVCGTCGRFFTGSGGQCAQHRRGQTYQARVAARALVRGWVEANGLVCPGWHRARHPVATIHDLTEDHLVPVSKGGLNGPRRVLCLSCNSARGAADA